MESMSSSSTSPSDSNDCRNMTHNLLGLLRELLQAMDTATAAASAGGEEAVSTAAAAARERMKQIGQTLQEEYKLGDIIQVLIPSLFGDADVNEQENENAMQEDNESLTSLQALQVLQYLVQSQEDVYLKVAAATVRKEAERRFLSTSTSTTLSPRMHLSDEFLRVLVSLLAHSIHVEVSTHAASTVVYYCRTLQGSARTAAATIILQTIASYWKSALDQLSKRGISSKEKAWASTVAVRCTSAVVDLVSIDDVLFGLAAAAPAAVPGAGGGAAAMDWMLQMLSDGSDPLLQMSILDLLETLATGGGSASASSNNTLQQQVQHPQQHPQRNAWLFSGAVVEPLLTMAGAGGTDPDGEDDEDPDPILGGPALRVLAALCKVAAASSQQQAHAQGGTVQNSQLFQQDHGHGLMIARFHRALVHFEVTSELDRLACLDAISSFASALPDCLELVLNNATTREMWLSLAVAQPKLKAAILHSVARVLYPPLVLEQQQRQQAAADSAAGTGATPAASSNLVPPKQLALRLYSTLGSVNGNETSTSLVLKLAKSPLPELRLAAYAVLTAMAHVPTGAQVLFLHGDFFEFLLSRDTENTVEGRLAKYELVQTVYKSEVKGLLADDIVRKLETFLKQGPHYVKTISWELAVE